MVETSFTCISYSYTLICPWIVVKNLIYFCYYFSLNIIRDDPMAAMPINFPCRSVKNKNQILSTRKKDIVQEYGK